MRRLIVGCGYLGQRVATRWLAAGDSVSALTRSPENATKLGASGVVSYLGDVLDSASLGQLPEVDTVLWAVGWDRSSGKSQQDVYVTGLRNTLQHLAGRCAQLIYISSTSVYGQSAGEWVDENADCQPTQPNGQVCLTGEVLVRQFRNEQPARATVLRLSGIYGPGRLLSRVAALQAGEPLTGNPDAWLNLIHVDDAAEAVLCCAKASDPHPLYLVSDDEPLRRRTYYAALAELVGAPPPNFGESDSPRGRRSGDEPLTGLNKRCRNTLAKQALAWHLQFPTYRQGLPQAICQTG